MTSTSCSGALWLYALKGALVLKPARNYREVLSILTNADSRKYAALPALHKPSVVAGKPGLLRRSSHSSSDSRNR